MDTSSLHKNKFPKLRFPKFNDSWQSKKLQDVLSEHKTRNKDVKVKEVFSVAKNKGVINQIEHLGRAFSSDDLSNYKVTFQGDVIYTKSPTADFPFGIIKQNHTGRIGLVSTLYAVFKPVSFEVGYLLHLYFLSPTNTFNYLNPLVHKGAKNTLNIGNNDFLNGAQICLPPSKEEQLKIVTFVNVVNEWIENLRTQKTKLSEYKYGMMQKLFAQELRFKDENGKNFPDWETTTLNEVFRKKSQRNSDNKCKDVLTNSAVRGIVSQRDYFEKDIANQENLLNYYVVDLDDFVYNPRISNFAPVGPLKRNKSGRGIMSPLYTILTLNKGDLGFYEYYFDTSLWHPYMYMISNFGARHDRMNIRDTDLMKMPLPFPVDKEQKKIAQFLNSIDELIKAKAEQVDKAETWKKGLLQKMFV